MHENPDKHGADELKAWIKQQLDSVVQEMMDKGAFQSVIVEAKPAWTYPFGVLICKVREQGHAGGFDWLICGNFPTDHVHSSLASTPREAARHFALKWQLEASRKQEARIRAEPGKPTASSTQLTEMAESLYELVEQDSLWPQ